MERSWLGSEGEKKPHRLSRRSAFRWKGKLLALVCKSASTQGPGLDTSSEQSPGIPLRSPCRCLPKGGRHLGVKRSDAEPHYSPFYTHAGQRHGCFRTGKAGARDVLLSSHSPWGKAGYIVPWFKFGQERALDKKREDPDSTKYLCELHLSAFGASVICQKRRLR